MDGCTESCSVLLLWVWAMRSGGIVLSMDVVFTHSLHVYIIETGLRTKSIAIASSAAKQVVGASQESRERVVGPRCKRGRRSRSKKQSRACGRAQ